MSGGIIVLSLGTISLTVKCLQDQEYVHVWGNLWYFNFLDNSILKDLLFKNDSNAAGPLVILIAADIFSLVEYKVYNEAIGKNGKLLV